MKPLLILTAGLFSPPKKCSGTRIVTLLFGSMRWKSACRTWFLYGCIWKARSTHSCSAPSRVIVRMEEWNFSFCRL